MLLGSGQDQESTTDQVGKSWLGVDLRKGWGRNDPYMILIAAQGQVRRAYLIPSQELESYLGARTSLMIPPDRVGWRFEERLVFASK